MNNREETLEILKNLQKILIIFSRHLNFFWKILDCSDKKFIINLIILIKENYLLSDFEVCLEGLKVMGLFECNPDELINDFYKEIASFFFEEYIKKKQSVLENEKKLLIFFWLEVQICKNKNLIIKFKEIDY